MQRESISTALVLAAVVLFIVPSHLRADDEADEEQLLFAEPPGWHEVFAEREENLSTTEYVPEGQSDNDWEEMLTVQVLLETPDADPDQLLSSVVNHLSGECDAYAAQPIELGGTGDYPTLGLMSMCGDLKYSDGGEFILIRGIAGKENFYLLQKSWRTPKFDLRDEPPVDLKQRKFWLGYLAYLRICSPERGDCPKADE